MIIPSTQLSIVGSKTSQRKAIYCHTIVGQMWDIKKVFPTTFYFTPYILTKISVHAYPYFLLKKLGLLLKFLFIWSFLFCIISCHLPKITRQISTHHCILSMADIARRKDGNRWRRRRERGEKARWCLVSEETLQPSVWIFFNFLNFLLSLEPNTNYGIWSLGNESQ